MAGLRPSTEVARDSCLALDISTRNCGWACDGPGNRPVYGLIKLPGMASLGKLYAAAYSAVDGLVEEHAPARVVWCLAHFMDAQTTARALNGVQAIVELVCHDRGVKAFETIESKARKAVLGRGSFGGKDEFGRLIPGLGSKQAKALAAAWCDRMGYAPLQSDDVADSLVLWHYDVMLRKQRNDDRNRMERYSRI